MKAVACLALLPLATAFVPAAPKAAPRAAPVKSSGGLYEEGARPVGGVQFFPSSENFWDPAGLAKDDETLAKYQAAEIKHGRVAMLAALDYFVHGNGVHLPGDLGGVPFDSIPMGLSALPVVPALGWAQIAIFASALEFLAPQKEGKVPGNVQPDTSSFPVPGDLEIRTKEINNGRLAMVSVLGMWVGELVSGGKNPFESLDAILPPY